jgi:hypothetical protein
MIGMQDRTGTTHLVHSDGHGLVQNCGMARSQHLYLTEMPEGTEVTCRKCAAAEIRRSNAKPIREPVTYGNDWTITDLRQIAKDIKLPGRTTMTGDQLFTELQTRCDYVN